MKIHILFILALSVFLVSCSSTQQKKPSTLVTEAKKEQQTESSEQTKVKLMEILKQDSSITDVERSKLLVLVDEGFAKNREFEILGNQKKALLIREYTKPFPDHNKITKIKNEIKITYSRKLDDLMSLFDKMFEIVKNHPQSSERFIDRSIEDINRYQ